MATVNRCSIHCNLLAELLLPVWTSNFRRLFGHSQWTALHHFRSWNRWMTRGKSGRRRNNSIPSFHFYPVLGTSSRHTGGTARKSPPFYETEIVCFTFQIWFSSHRCHDSPGVFGRSLSSNQTTSSPFTCQRIPSHMDIPVVWRDIFSGPWQLPWILEWPPV